MNNEKMAYLVLAYPIISNSDLELIQKFRRVNDELYYDVVKPHFTIVFPVFRLSETEFIAEIKKQSNNLPSFNFSIRCSTMTKDAFSEYYHSLLVPDEGYSNIVKIHDKLYRDKLIEDLRLDIDFVPHIGIGNSMEKFKCKKMVDNWNSKDFEINGTVTHLTIVEFENNVVRTLDEIKLEI
ncbi:2'-5' RNA ligase family protein [Kriegella aquimaris]|uniref:2'-5' RNA ligase superfamily protein n=1 Tax=Kriegella aquimaris TaxID=192904 RepID=A0A1G9YMI5_9FLAO|nr:2'-5' RNA ligase family protein [Kriegella aquimaris]SDN10374.1 2'-5' RNA ligase superfamily protein [Kriegella aquimaris]